MKKSVFLVLIAAILAACAPAVSPSAAVPTPTMEEAAILVSSCMEELRYTGVDEQTLAILAAQNCGTVIAPADGQFAEGAMFMTLSQATNLTGGASTTTGVWTSVGTTTGIALDALTVVPVYLVGAELLTGTIAGYMITTTPMYQERMNVLQAKKVNLSPKLRNGSVSVNGTYAYWDPNSGRKGGHCFFGVMFSNGGWFANSVPGPCPRDVNDKEGIARKLKQLWDSLGENFSWKEYMALGPKAAAAAKMFQDLGKIGYGIDLKP